MPMKRMNPLLLELLLLTALCVACTVYAAVNGHPRAGFMAVLSAAMLLNLAIAQFRHGRHVRTLQGHGYRKSKSAAK